MSETELKSLIRKRASIKSRLTNFSNYVDSVKNTIREDDCIAVELEQRILKFDTILSDFALVQDEIENVIEESELEKQFNERNTFEDSYFSIISIAKKILADLQSKKVENENFDSQSVHSLANSINNTVADQQGLNYLRYSYQNSMVHMKRGWNIAIRMSPSFMKILVFLTFKNFITFARH